MADQVEPPVIYGRLTRRMLLFAEEGLDQFPAGTIVRFQRSRWGGTFNITPVDAPDFSSSGFAGDDDVAALSPLELLALQAES